MNPKKIICICPNPSVDTYLSVDELKPAALNRVYDEKHFPGGKGIHVALAATELGEQAVVLGFWGGPTGKWLKESCVQFGVECFGVEVQDWNRINTTIRSEGNWNETELVAQGPSITNDEYNLFCKEFQKLLPDASAVVMSGSWPQGAPKDAYGLLIDLAKKFSIPVWIDCSGVVLQEALHHHPYGVHLNKSEMKAIVPPEFEYKPSAFFLQYVQQVALTSGAEGLLFSTHSETIHAHCDLEKIFSAVGSGDCLTAGLAVAFVRKYNNLETVKLATACGSANCVREELGLLHRKDVEELLHRIVIDSIV